MEEQLKKILGSLASNDNTQLTTEHFKIQNNLLKFKNDTVQISNISQIFAGKNKFNISITQVLISLVCLILFFSVENSFIKIIAMFGVIFNLVTMYKTYNYYINNKYILRFFMNSGTTYVVSFKDLVFLQEVRTVVEESILKKNLSYNIDTGDKMIFNGNGDIITGNNNNMNSGIQSGVNLHSNNNIDNSNDSISVENSHINNSNLGKENNSKIDQEFFDWDMLKREFNLVLDQLKIETPLKDVSEQAIKIIDDKNEYQFKELVRKYSTIFSSDFFLNTASGLLVQWISSLMNTQ